MQQYSFNKTVDVPFDDVIERVVDALKAEGFRLLTDIDLQAALKTKLDIDFRQYRILGACNPYFAHQALQIERHIGTMLPCNVVVQATDDGKVEVSAVDPIASMSFVKNQELEVIAEEVHDRLQRVVDGL